MIGDKKTSKTLIRFAILLFLFQATITFFSFSSGNSADGYTSVICTLAGTKMVFVSFDTDTPENSCIECPACSTLNHDDNWLPLVNSNVHDSIIVSTLKDNLKTVSLPKHLFLSYLSRAPPV